MLASGKGGVRLIPKYAVLKPLGEVEAARETPKGEAIAREKLLAAFEVFYSGCENMVPGERRSELHAARVRFLEAIDFRQVRLRGAWPTVWNSSTAREEAARLAGQLAATQAQGAELLARLAPVVSVVGEPAVSDTQPKA